MANKRERATGSPSSVRVPACPQPRSRLARLSVGLRSRRSQVFRPFTPHFDFSNTDRFQPSRPTPAKKPRAITVVIGIGIVMVIVIVIATHSHHETPLLVSPWVHGMVRPSSSIRRRPRWLWPEYYNHRRRQQECQEQQQQPSASTVSTMHHSTRPSLGPTSRGWRGLWLVITQVREVGHGKYGMVAASGKSRRFGLSMLYEHSTGSPACLISHLSHIRSPPGSP